MGVDAAGRITFFPDPAPVDASDLLLPPPSPLRRVDLRAAIGATDVEVTGVAIDATGKRYLLEATRGIYALADDGSARRIWDPLEKGVATGPFLDLFAYGRGLFGLTQRNEGFLVDPASSTVRRHFCYLPGGVALEGGELPPDGEQDADAIALLPALPRGTGDGLPRIAAQARTFDRASGRPIASHLALFGFASGESLKWLAFPAPPQGEAAPLLHARAMTWWEDRLLLVADDRGFGARLVIIDPDGWIMSTAGGTWERSLEERRIEALAWDPWQRTFLFVDGDADVLLELAEHDPWR